MFLSPILSPNWRVSNDEQKQIGTIPHGFSPASDPADHSTGQRHAGARKKDVNDRYREGCGVRIEDLPDVLTADDIASMLQCSPKTIYDMGARGIIPRVKVGRLVRFPKRGFIAWLEAGGEGAA